MQRGVCNGLGTPAPPRIDYALHKSGTKGENEVTPDPKWLQEIISFHKHNRDLQCLECQQVQVLLAHVQELRKALGAICRTKYIPGCTCVMCGGSRLLLREEAPKVE